jgi:hypothetical protein
MVASDENKGGVPCVYYLTGLIFLFAAAAAASAVSLASISQTSVSSGTVSYEADILAR